MHHENREIILLGLKEENPTRFYGSEVKQRAGQAIP